MSIVDNIRAHYQTQLNGELQKITVPEWKTDIYFRKTYTLKEEAGIMKYHSEGKTIEALVESIVVKARTMDGSRMFNPTDRVFLLNEADPDVVIRVATAINSATNNNDTIEVMEKN